MRGEAELHAYELNVDVVGKMVYIPGREWKPRKASLTTVRHRVRQARQARQAHPVRPVRPVH